jgi:hypothetical protein
LKRSTRQNNVVQPRFSVLLDSFPFQLIFVRPKLVRHARERREEGVSTGKVHNTLLDFPRSAISASSSSRLLLFLFLPALPSQKKTSYSELRKKNVRASPASRDALRESDDRFFST